MFKKLQGTSASSSLSSSSSSSSIISSSSSSSNTSNHSPVSLSPSSPPLKNTASISDAVKSELPNDKCPTTELEGKTTFNNKFPIFGKRRGGKVLPTGKVKKLKVEPKEEKIEEPKDAWSQYLAEVKKYKETTCEEEGKTRPLVK